MTGPKRTPAGSGMEQTRARRQSPWHEAAGLLVALAAAVGLWVLVVAGVAVPLGDALARLEAPRPPAPPACETPPHALASVARPAPAGPSCP